MVLGESRTIYRRRRRLIEFSGPIDIIGYRRGWRLQDGMEAWDAVLLSFNLILIANRRWLTEKSGLKFFACKSQACVFVIFLRCHHSHIINRARKRPGSCRWGIREKYKHEHDKWMGIMPPIQEQFSSPRRRRSVSQRRPSLSLSSWWADLLWLGWCSLVQIKEMSVRWKLRHRGMPKLKTWFVSLIEFWFIDRVFRTERKRGLWLTPRVGTTSQVHSFIRLQRNHSVSENQRLKKFVLWQL